MADIKEILVQWEAGGATSTISGIAATLGYSRPTVRKYVRVAEQAGLVRGSRPADEAAWERLARAVVAQVGTIRHPGTATARLAPYHDYLAERVGQVRLSVLHQRLCDEHQLAVSWATFYRYVRTTWPGRVQPAPQVTVPLTALTTSPPGEEGQVDFFYVGRWEDPESGRQRRLSAADRRSELITQAERNGTPYPEQPKGKVLLVIGDAAETTDTLYPWMRMMEAGYDCVVAAPEVREYQLVNHERPEGWHITRETPGYMFRADIAFKDVKPEEYAAILLSGGRAPEYIRYDKQLNDLVRWFVNNGRPVGSVCHGVEILATADVIRGKRVTCVPKCQFDAEMVGATYVAAPVVVDGLIVTARGARDGWLWMREFLKVLERTEAAPAGAAAGAASTARG